MNTSDSSAVFFAKPSFRNSVQNDVLKGPARRALKTFETGYRFSCSFFPIIAPQTEREDRHLARDPQPADNASLRGEGLSAWELERLIERNLLPQFRDETAPKKRHQDSFRPEMIELSALLVIVSVVLAKLFVG